jgi:Tfp pilus assembly protein PilF
VEPNHLVALNNLAWLLAHRGAKGEEALALINQALLAYGPRGDLLDTRALVFLSMQQCERARADLEAAIRDTPTATRYFHLGRVLRLANDPAGASSALLKAKSLGLKRSQLHPAELLASATLLEGLE